MSKYVEIVPPPAEVDIVFYDPEVGHIAVAPSSHHEDGAVVGVTHVGLDKELTYVRLGDAIITYPDGSVFVKKAADVSAFFAPVDEGFLKLEAKNPEAENLLEVLGAKPKRKSK